MAIHTQEEVQHQKGHLKTIDESGIRMIFDTLQKYQYSFPIKSVVREILSNGFDSVAEKKVARDILTGKAKVSDYFVEIEGDLYKDSKFDAAYYDLNWFSNEDNVEMRYVSGPALGKDQVLFMDHGVGLSGKRLEGYFKLGYSTKRLSKLPLGKFGLGAKSPLSLNIPFYTMESRYNGMLFRFNIYSSKVDSIIPRFNLDTEKDNPFILFNEGTPDEYPVYYLPTKAKNGVVVIAEAKKHQKQQFIDAVKSQMLYFDNIRLTQEDPSGAVTAIPYQAKILYEDDLIVMSDNDYFSKPHLLLNKVNYGYIDWNELELEEKSGNIGIKVAPEDVDVNPSRESVLWTEQTKEKVLDRFRQVVDIATNLIQKELKAEDFFDWLKTCYSIWNKYSQYSGILGRLAKVVDLSAAKLKFVPDPRIVFDTQRAFGNLFTREVTVFVETASNGTRKRKVLRSEFGSWATRMHMPIFLMEQGERSGNRKDKYLASLHDKGFITIEEPYATLEHALEAKLDEKQIDRLYKGVPPSVREAYWDAIKASPHITWYKDVEVPEEFNSSDEEVEQVEAPKETKEEKEVTKTAKQTAEQRRKATGKVLINTPMMINGIYQKHDPRSPTGSVLHVFDNKSMEIPIAEINNWTAPEVYYGTKEDDELMALVALLTRDSYHANRAGKPVRAHAQTPDQWVTKKWYRLNKDKFSKTMYFITVEDAYKMQHFFDTNVMLVKVSQSNTKYLRDFQPITNFFQRIKNNRIVMSNTLVQWNTARMVLGELNKCAFLYNFPFNSQYQEMYHRLTSYVKKHYREVWENLGTETYGINKQTYDHLLQHLSDIGTLQKYVAENPKDKEGIALIAGKLFGNKTIIDGMAYDPEIMEQLNEVLEFARSCGVMLNHLPVLTGYNSYTPEEKYSPTKTRSAMVQIPEELEGSLRSYLSSIGMLDYKREASVSDEDKKKILDTLYS